MHIVLAILGIGVAAYFWINRARAAARGGAEILDMANDVRLAARRFGFTRKSNIHPVDAVDDPRLTAAALLHAIGLEAGPLSAEEVSAILVQMQSKFQIDKAEAGEMAVFGNWLVGQSASPATGIDRLAKRTLALGGPDTYTDLNQMLNAIYGTGTAARQEALADGMAELKRVYRIN